MRKCNIIFLVMLAVLLCSCQKESRTLPPPIELYEEIQSKLQLGDMVNVVDYMLESNTGIGTDLYEEAVYCILRDSTSPDQVIIICAKDPDAADLIEKQLNSWLAYQIDAARIYMTENMPLLQTGVVRRDGLMVSLIVSSQVDEMLEIYSSLK